MRRFVFALTLFAALTAPALADMYPDASNAKLPEALANLDIGAINVQAYGAVADGVRVQCAVTTTASATAVTVAPGNTLCAFAPADAGKPIVIWNAGSSPSAPLATTIAGVADPTHLVLAAAPGQTLAAATQYVSWGTDNAAAIQAAYNQAAKQVAAGGQQGHVYFPPATATSGGVEVRRYYGTTANVGMAPSGYRIATQGAGAFKSVVLALAPNTTTSLAYESSAYSDGNVMRDIGFDGNMLTTRVGWLRCSPNSTLDNVRFATAAPGGTTLEFGEAGVGGCPGLVATGVRLDSTLNGSTDPTRFPNKHLVVNATDTQWYGLLPSGRTTTSHVHIASGAGNTLMVGPHTGSPDTGGSAFQIDASVVKLLDPQIDNAGGPAITGITINAASVKVFGGRLQSPNAATVGIAVGANRAGIGINGFDCNRFTTTANCIQLAYPLGVNVQLSANGSSTIVPQTSQISNVSYNTTDLVGVMVGLAGAITPTLSDFVNLNASGNIGNTVSGSGFQVVMRYGTGAAPAAGVACTGTATGGSVSGTSAAAGQQLPFALSGRATTVPGTAYWYDLCLFALTSGQAVGQHLTMRAIEYDRGF